MTLHFLNDVVNDIFDAKLYNDVIIASLKSESVGKLINRIQGLHLLMSSLPGSALRMHVESLGKISKDTYLVFTIYTDKQKKRYSKILSCTACGSQTRAVQAYHDPNLDASLGVILICRFCLQVCWLIYMYIF